MKKHINMAIFLVFSYLLILSIVKASAYESLDLCKMNSGITENSMFIKIVTDR